MEDYQEQEYEFLRRLEDERIDRRKLLKRGLGAGIGLTIISLSDTALAARTKALAEPPLRGTKQNLAALVAAAKKEGHLNLIAMPSDWANYGQMFSTFTKKYGIPVTVDNPQAPRRRRTRRSSRSRGIPVLLTPSTSPPCSQSLAPARACMRSTSTVTSRPSRGR